MLISVTAQKPGKAKVPLGVVPIQKEITTRMGVSHLLQALQLDVGVLHLLVQTEVQRPLAPVLFATLLPLQSHEFLRNNTGKHAKTNPLFLSQPCSCSEVTMPITARLQGALLLQTSHTLRD